MCYSRIKKKNNDNSNNKLTKGKGGESTTKVMFHEELCSVAVYREAEEEACAAPIGERYCVCRLPRGRMKITLWTLIIGLLSPRRCKIVS